MTAAVGRLEALLIAIYDLRVDCRVADFLVTDRQSLPGECRDAPGDEQLFVAAVDDGLCMSLYLDAGVLERLERHDPHDALDAGNVADCWTVLEGVSHFLCVAHHAGHDRPVSRLTLELQAEIDKYVASFLLLCRSDPRRFPAELHALLFRRATVDPLLAAGRESLYRRASRCAARFCGRLEPALRAFCLREDGSWLAELRRFYRLSDAGKLRHIERLAAA
ncbi:MAG TPA: hypothetical protein VFR29_00595 [Steroidobacteraceae bacterium]|nr:hypothetical protein [Steroidobacteraceae bacterium]